MAKSYRRPAALASFGKDGAAPYSVPNSGDTRPHPGCGSKKLVDQFRDKMRALHYALATEKSYRHWIVEFVRFHRRGSEWRHPTDMGKAEIEAFLTHLAIDRHVAPRTQNQAFSAILFLYKQVLGMDLPTIDALRAKESRRLPVELSQQEVKTPEAQELMEKLKAQYGEDMAGFRKAWMKEWMEMSGPITQKHIQKYIRGVMFYATLQPENDSHYTGKDVNLGTPDRPIFWYKPTGADKYRVIYADLSVKEMIPDDVHKLLEAKDE